jgi:hypothetical protein
MSEELDCDIKLTLCNNTKKYNRAKIDKLAVKCGLNPKDYSSRTKLCDAIIKENLKNKGVPVISPKKVEIPKRKIVEDDEEPLLITVPKKIAQIDDNEDPELYIYNGKPLKDYIVKLLRPIAKELGVSKYGSVNRPQLVQGIKEADLKRKLSKPKVLEKPILVEEPVVIEKPKKKKVVVIDEEPLKQKTIQELITDAVRSFGNYNDLVDKFPKFGDLRKAVISILIENNVDADKIMAIDYKEIIKNVKQEMKDELNIDDKKKE